MTSFSRDSLVSLPAEERDRIIRSLSPNEAEALLYDWRFWARPEQVAPDGKWDVWLVCAGRGFGKTRTGAEWIQERVEQGARSIAFAGRTAADVRDTMVEGESGILRIAKPGLRPLYQPSKRRLVWPNGAEAHTYSADKPDQMRGPNTDTVWADELAAWQYPDSWAQLEFGLRSLQSGLRPQACVTTTPRPTPIVKELLRAETSRVTRGSTYANAANLAPSFIAKLQRKYEGTRLGRQEIFAHLLDDAPGAFWKRDDIDATRVKVIPELVRIIIAVDPAVSTGDDADETGIVVVGLGVDGHGYVLEDHSGRYTPTEWAMLVCWLFDEHKANLVVCETNQGGDLVESNLRTIKRDLPIRRVHASKGKRTRAEPVATLYEQKRVHHLGQHPELEDQLCSWEPDIVEAGKHKKSPSPDRLDALVYGITFLMVDRDPDRRKAGRSGMTFRTPSLA